MSNHNSNQRHRALALSLVACMCLACTGVHRNTARFLNDRHRSLLDTYVTALRSGDLSVVPFAPNVTFQGPLSGGPLEGEAKVREFLAPVAQGVKDIRVDRYIVDGDFAALVATLETKDGKVVPFCEVVQFSNQQIVRLRPYFDPRKLLAPAE